MVHEDNDNLTAGLNDLLDFQLTEWRSGYARLEVELDERHRNRQGGIHGGVTAALIDAATGYCGIYEPDSARRRNNATVSLNINFVGRPNSNRLIAEAKLDRAGRRLYFALARVTDGSSNLVATAEAVYTYVDRTPSPEKK